MALTGLRRNVAWLIAVRAIVSTILLGSATVTQITAPGAFPVDPFFFLIGLTYALTIGYALTVVAFIYFTGGITSYFTSLFVLPIVAGSMVQFRRGGLLVATLSAILYVGLVVAQYMSASNWLPYHWLNNYAASLPLPSF